MTETNQPPHVDAAERRWLVEHALELLEKKYVFPDVARRIAESVRTRLLRGEYDEVADAEALAALLTAHLREANGDRHLSLRYHREPQSPSEGDIWRDPAWIRQYEVEAALDNYGIHEVRRLPGNVGYILLTSLDEAEYTAEAVVAAMNLVANTSALIFDLRRNNGGAPTGVALWCSYLFPAEPVHLNDVYCRQGDATQQYWTLPFVPGRRYLGKPAYVLTSGRTFSGAEEFAYNLKNLGRATIVGETTLGGANPVEAYRLDPHFELRVAVCRAINPVTGTNWEGVGVEPDIAVPAEDALERAHREALARIIEDLGENPEGPLGDLADEARGALEALEPHGI